MLIKILIAIVVILGGFLIYVSTLPTTMLVARDIVIAASPEALFPYINNSKKANDWMPWKDSDPEAVMTYSGPDEGVGSKSSWDSKGQMGSGEALVIEIVPNKLVKTQLTYTKPFQMQQLAEISLTPEGTTTRVRWSVAGELGYFFRLIGVFVDCKKMIADEFDKGLVKLKAQAEAK